MAKECVLANIRVISELAQAYFTQRIKEENLPILANHMSLFFILPENKDKLLFNELARRFNISKSSLSDMITKYKNIGLIDIAICHSDKRTMYVGLSDEALLIRSKLNEFELEFLDKMLVGFTSEEKNNFRKQVIVARKNITN